MKQFPRLCASRGQCDLLLLLLYFCVCSLGFLPPSCLLQLARHAAPVRIFRCVSKAASAPHKQRDWQRSVLRSCGFSCFNEQSDTHDDATNTSTTATATASGLPAPARLERLVLEREPAAVRTGAAVVPRAAPVRVACATASRRRIRRARAGDQRPANH